MINDLLSISDSLLDLSQSLDFTADERNYILDVVRKALEVVVIEIGQVLKEK